MSNSRRRGRTTSNNKAEAPKDSDARTKIILAIIGIVGTVITGILGYQQIRASIEIPIRATQTAEARLTVVAGSATSGQLSMATESATTTSTATTQPKTETPEPAPSPTHTPVPKSYSIAISEVMANPCGPSGDTDYWNEYVELYNYGDTPVDVEGWWLTDGEDLKGNPDRLIAWSSRFSQVSMGNQVQTATAVVPPGRYAVILSPGYLQGEGDFRMPYIFAEGTILLTVDNGTHLGSDDFGIEVTQFRNALVLYEGTGSLIYQVVSTYGSPILSGSPKNIRDDGKDGIPFALRKCHVAERQELSGPDTELNWRELNAGSPGTGP